MTITARLSHARLLLACLLSVLLVGGATMLWFSQRDFAKTRMTAYFDNSNGIFVGDEVRILGVPVGEIDRIEPQPQRAKITFWVASKYKVPAEANAVILSPSLVTSRAIQLTPAYTSGPTMADNAVIPQSRTAVPVEWDDFRRQLEKLTETLQPTQPGGTSSLGNFINTAADNLRGQGGSIREALTKLSQAMSVLGDHSDDIFSTVKNLSTLVSAMQSSQDLMRHLNVNLATVTGLLSDDPNGVGNAVTALNAVIGDVKGFVADNKETLGTTTDKLTAVTNTLNANIGDIKQTLHIAPNTIQNYVNIYQPAQGTLSGALALNNFANPVSFICGAIQAASRMNFDLSSKLCVQYLSPIIKNRQYNFPPLGENLFVGATARPNEVTYSEDWMRPDYIPPPMTGAAPQPVAAPAGGAAPQPVAAPAGGAAPQPVAAPAGGAAPRAEVSNPVPPAPVSANLSAGLAGLMMPPARAGS